MNPSRLFLLTVMASAPIFAKSQTLTFNEKWWSHTLSDEQQGFIYGYQDCRQPKNAVVGSIVDYQDYVTHYLESHRVPDRQSVPFAIRTAEQHMKPRVPLKGGETWSGPHGYLDGGWWGLPDRNSLFQQRGFVEGYLFCATRKVNISSVEHYVDKVNAHYAAKSTERDAIADVLKPLIAKQNNNEARLAEVDHEH
jgi:hypothetical protein